MNQVWMIILFAHVGMCVCDVCVVCVCVVCVSPNLVVKKAGVDFL